MTENGSLRCLLCAYYMLCFIKRIVENSTLRCINCVERGTADRGQNLLSHAQRGLVSMTVTPGAHGSGVMVGTGLVRGRETGQQKQIIFPRFF